MRAARLISLVLLLQSHGTLTARRLAEQLGVSPRTIARDVLELADAGIPVHTERGRAGGYRLVDGFRARFTGLGRAEVEALFLSGAPDALRAMGFDEAALAARLKVGAALAPSLRDAPGRVAARFHLDAPGWFRRAETPPPLTPLSRAVWNDLPVTVRYRPGRRLAADRDPEPVNRRLLPYGLVLKAGVWYLIAGVDDGFRVYRVDRFDEVAEEDEPFRRDDDFDLAAFWAESADRFARSMLRERIEVRLSPHGVARLPAVVEPHAHAEAVANLVREADGWSRTVLLSETLDVAYDELLRLGADVEVVAPAGLRERLARTATLMCERYR